MDLRTILDNDNLATKLKEEDLIEIGNKVVEGYESDKISRTSWEKKLESYVKLALQVKENKTFPWPDASNVKYPLLSTAAMQFAARAYPSLVPSSGGIVKCKVIGSDQDGQKALRAKRIKTHMSYQILEEMENWEEDMDKMLLILPIMGTAFKKTYFDKDKNHNCSELVLGTDLIVNYWAKDIKTCERKTEKFYLSKRQVKEKIGLKIFKDVELEEPTGEVNHFSNLQDNQSPLPQIDDTTSYLFLEQHTYLDLDKDDYAEPYIVTVEFTSRKVVSIVKRFHEENISFTEKGGIAKIESIEYYTKFGFIPSPDGSFYDIGFGQLLGPINESINTLINQLVDSGSLNNLQAGFISKGLRVRSGDTRFKPGEWKVAQTAIDDLKKGIFPLPTKEPSAVLFQLLGLLIQSGKELASVAEIFVGKMPGQNTPAYTTKETVEQGMKLFTAVYKRVFRAMKEEFRKLYKLNALYLDDQTYIDILDEAIPASDYKGYSENDIVPSADPNASSQTEKLTKLQGYFPLLQLGTINPLELTKRYLEANEEPNLEALIMQPQPKPDPKLQAIQMKTQADMQKSQQTMEMDKVRLQMEQQRQQFEMMLEKQKQEMELYFKQLEASIDLKNKAMDHQFEMKKAQDQHVMGTIQGAQQHEQKMQQQDEMFKFKKENEPKVREPKEPKAPKPKN